MKSVKKCVKYFVLITADLRIKISDCEHPMHFELSQTEFVRHAKEQDSTNNSQLQIWSTTDMEPRQPGSLQACFLNFIRQILTYYFKTGHYGFQATPCNLHFILQPSPCSFAINHPRKINLHNSFTHNRRSYDTYSPMRHTKTKKQKKKKKTACWRIPNNNTISKSLALSDLEICFPIFTAGRNRRVD